MSIKNIIGVMSCKGGVGKSTIAVNLAVTLASFYGKKVGILDADVYGPNIPRLLGVTDFFDFKIDDEVFIPVLKYNIYSMSFGYFLKADSSVLLRGPIISNTIKYLFSNTQWGDLDILIVDFPPGTGDVYLSLLRDFSFSGVILITTPQILSIDDVKKSIFMLKKFKIDIYCLLENMKFLSCTNCGCVNYMYGNSDFTKQLISYFNIRNYYELPFFSAINDSVISGVPFVLSNFCTNKFVNLFKDLSNLVI